jgi:hypothetical protein
MLSASQEPMETEFGKILLQIIKNPTIPTNKDALFHPRPATSNRNPVATRLQRSQLSSVEYAKVREKWLEIIKEKNAYPGSKGLSYDAFIAMVCELFGCEDEKDEQMPINRTAVVNLVNTGNPYTKAKSPTSLQEDNLKFLCCFTEIYVFEELKEIGDRVLAAFRGLKQNHAPTKLNLSLKQKPEDNYSKNGSVKHLDVSIEQNKVEERDEPKTFTEREKNLRSLIVKVLQDKGAEYFVEAGISGEELLMLTFSDNPQVHKETFVKLPNLLGISHDEFWHLFIGDDLPRLDNVGF